MFVTYGVQFTSEKIKFYINGQDFFSYNLDDYDFKNGNLTDMRSKTIRLSSGQLTGGGSQNCSVPCSSQMKIDYVRVYLPTQQNAIAWLDNQSVVCEGKEKVVAATYIAGVVYSWSSPAFDIEKLWSGSVDSYVKIKSKPGTLPEHSYPITLISTFPDGHTETLVRQFYVSQGSSVTPPSSLGIECYSDYCESYIGESMSSCGCSDPNIYEWSTDDGATWHNYGTFYAFSRTTASSAYVCVRTKNCNGTSSPICREIPENSAGPRSGKPTVEQIDFIAVAYPNPVQNDLTLLLPKDADEQPNTSYKVFILDASGKILFEKKLSREESIDASNLPTGTYFLAVKWGDNGKRIYKFIKTN